MTQAPPSEAGAIAAFIAGQRRFWALGDYHRVAVHLEAAAAPLVAACGIGAGNHVLDVGAGDGNVAVAAAAAGAGVVASDLTPELVARGRERTRGMDVEWVEADAEALPFADMSFDAALSAFSLQYAPRPAVALAETLRVLRPGGVLGLASWTPDGYTAEMSAIALRHLPPPTLATTPWLWGDEATVRERLDPVADVMEIERDAIRWEFASIDDARHHLEANTPIVLVAAQTLPADAYAALVDELVDLVIRRGERAPDGAIAVPGDYLRAVARTR
jgi:2-polyprenyl-6-hydroxyphenyl methylase/3-demethylubiquinone-9 3-methyltransferase